MFEKKNRSFPFTLDQSNWKIILSVQKQKNIKILLCNDIIVYRFIIYISFVLLSVVLYILCQTNF